MPYQPRTLSRGTLLPRRRRVVGRHRHPSPAGYRSTAAERHSASPWKAAALLGYWGRRLEKLEKNRYSLLIFNENISQLEPMCDNLSSHTADLNGQVLLKTRNIHIIFYKLLDIYIRFFKVCHFFKFSIKRRWQIVRFQQAGSLGDQSAKKFSRSSSQQNILFVPVLFKNLKYSLLRSWA